MIFFLHTKNETTIQHRRLPRHPWELRPVRVHSHWILVMLPWAAVALQRLGMQDREDPNGWHICATESHFPDQNFKTSGYWPIDGHHGALEADGVAVSRWNLMYPLLPLDA